MQVHVRVALLVVALAAIPACSSPDDPADAAPGIDARADSGRASDGGGADPGDAGAERDAGAPKDAGADAGREEPACEPRPACPPCPAGETCGGGGVLHQCGTRACTHYVSPSALTTTTFATCTTADAPCTLATANGSARAGDVVCLAGGMYRTSIAPRSPGTAGAPIVFAAADPASPPVIRGVTTGIL